MESKWGATELKTKSKQRQQGASCAVGANCSADLDFRKQNCLVLKIFSLNGLKHFPPAGTQVAGVVKISQTLDIQLYGTPAGHKKLLLLMSFRYPVKLDAKCLQDLRHDSDTPPCRELGASSSCVPLRVCTYRLHERRWPSSLLLHAEAGLARLLVSRRCSIRLDVKCL